MRAGEFTAGTALLPAFDPQTTKVFRHLQQRLKDMTPAELDHEEAQVEALPGRVADELRRMVAAERTRRARLSLAPLAGGTR